MQTCRSPIFGRSPRAARSGFTLLELMLVLVITAMVAAFVLPRLFNVQGREILRGAANQLSGAMIDARQQSMLSGQSTFLMYETNTGLYAIVPEPVDDQSSAEFDQVTSLLNQAASSATLGGGSTDVANVNNGGSTTLIDKLPRGVQFLIGQTGQAQENDMQGIQADVTGLPYVAFSPDGTSDDAILELINEERDRITIQLRGLTGAVRVGELLPDGLATPSIAPNGVR